MLILVFAARIRASLKLCSRSTILCAAILWQGSLAAKGPDPVLQSAGAAGSLYELESVWKDQAGQNFTLADSRDQVVLLSMIYTSCEHTCPLIMGEIKNILKGLPKALQPKVQVLLFSFDPDRDSPQRLSAYAAERKLDKNWRLLHGSMDDVEELAAVLNFRVKRLTSGDFSHSNSIFILDQKGRILHHQSNLYRGREQSIEALNKLLK